MDGEYTRLNLVFTFLFILFIIIILICNWDFGGSDDKNKKINTKQDKEITAAVVEEESAEVVPKISETEEEIPPVPAATYPANKMTHYIMDGKDANKCIAGRWCIGKDLTIAKDTSIRYGKYFVWAVHCSVIKEWRGSIIKVYYKDGGVETGIVLDCGGFAGHKDRMDKAMGKRYNGKIDNGTLSRYIIKAEVIRKGW